MTQGGGACSWQCGRPGFWGARGPQRVHAGWPDPPVGTQHTLMGRGSLSSEVQTLLSASVWPGMSQWLGLTASGAASWVQPLSAQMGKLRPRVFRRLRASVSFPGWGCDGCTFPWSHSVWGLGGGKHALGASPVLQASALISARTGWPHLRTGWPHLAWSGLPCRAWGLPVCPSLLLASHTCLPVSLVHPSLRLGEEEPFEVWGRCRFDGVWG